MSTLTVKRVANLADVTSDTVRHYVKIGLLSPGRDKGNNYKLFTSNDVKRVRFIRRAQQLGFNLEDIRLLLDGVSKESASEQDAKRLIHIKMGSIRKTIAELNKLHQCMEHTVSPEMAHHANAVSHMIENWDK